MWRLFFVLSAKKPEEWQLRAVPSHKTTLWPSFRRCGSCLGPEDSAVWRGPRKAKIGEVGQGGGRTQGPCGGRSGLGNTRRQASYWKRMGCCCPVLGPNHCRPPPYLFSQTHLPYSKSILPSFARRNKMSTQTFR